MKRSFAVSIAITIAITIVLSLLVIPFQARASHVVVGPAEVQIIQPSGATVSTLGTTVQVFVSNFTLEPQNIGGANDAGHGHLDVHINDVFSSPGSVGESVFDIVDLPAGTVKIGVELVNNNHASFSPQVWSNITVTAVAPSISFVTPAEGGSVSTEGARFQVDVAGFELDTANYNGNPIPGHGHYHVFMDGSFTGITPTEPTFTIPSFTPGDHTVFVDLRTNNHAPLVPSVNHTINVTAVAPAITIMSPADGGSVSTEGAQFTVAIAGLELDGENYNGNPIPGHGHYHVFVDDLFTGITPTEPTFTIPSFTAGSHTVKVDLRTNNHMPLSPTAEHTITVTAVDPSISIIAPAADAMVSTLGAQFTVAIDGWELDGENYNGNPIAGHGHYHVFMDGSFTGITPTEPTFRIPSFTPGAHTIFVDLRTNNHAPLVPSVNNSISVTAAAPSILIMEPADGATVNSTVFVRVQIQGFIIDPEAIGQVSVPGRGHYHVTVDGTTIDFAVTGLIYALKDLAEGSHTLAVSLHNNDHTPLSPAVSHQISMTVAAPAPPPPPPPAGVDQAVFIGTTVGLLIALAAVAIVLFLWGRGQRGGGSPPT